MNRGIQGNPEQAPRPIWSKRGARELALNALLIAITPLVARILSGHFTVPLEHLGFGGIYSRLTGEGGWSDVGWEVVSSKALVDPGYSAYDTLKALDPLIGMGWPVEQAHTHPPFALPLGLPLAFLDYSWWLSFWIVAMMSAIALSMRVMRVPPWIAYPLALGIALSYPGRFSLEGTYPFMALVLAIAWRYRDHALIAAPCYVILGASRGVGLVLLAYPAARRQWRTLMAAIGALVALTLIALAFEPAIFGDFATKARLSIEINLARGDLVTIDSILQQRGFPAYSAWAAALMVVAVGLYRKQELFWLLAWLSFAVAPIAWYQTPIMGIPLAVIIWQSGRSGAALMLVAGASVVSTTVPMSLDWLVFVTASGIALMTSRVGDDTLTDVHPAPVAPAAALA